LDSAFLLRSTNRRTRHAYKETLLARLLVFPSKHGSVTVISVVERGSVIRRRTTKRALDRGLSLVNP
jgi:hypothetical protein